MKVIKRILSLFLITIMIVTCIPSASLTSYADYDGTQGDSGNSSGDVGGGPSYIRTACIFYVVNKAHRGKVSEYGIITPKPINYSGYNMEIRPRYDWGQIKQSGRVYPDMPYPIASSGLASNGLAVRRWLEQKDSSGNEFYWYVMVDLFGAEFTKTVKANASDYVVIIEPIAWYRSPAHGKIGGTANGLAKIYAAHGDPDGKKDVKVQRMAFESFPLSMIYETALFDVPAPTKTSGFLSGAEIRQYGYGIHRIEIEGGSGTHTWDYDLGTTPGPAPEEPEAQQSQMPYKIIKGYRTRTETGELKDPYGPFTRTETFPDITIEDEEEYRVVRWDKSTTASEPDPINWNPPGVTESGTTTGTVKLDKENKGEEVLYVLLEKPEKEEVEEPIENDADYILHQSHISKVISTKQTDKDGRNLMDGFKFIWVAGKVNNCSGHKYYTDCPGHSGGHNSNCTSDCTDSHTYYHDYDCEEHTDYCNSWHWTDTSLTLKPYNSQRESYPELIPVGLGDGNYDKWLQIDSIPKERTNMESDTYEVPEIDEYKLVIYRGKDKLSVPSWCTSVSGEPSKSDEVLAMGFDSRAEKSSLTRKTKDYIETFSMHFTSAPDADLQSQAQGSCAHGQCTKTDTAKLQQELDINSSVYIEVYSGEQARPKMGEVTQKSKELDSKKRIVIKDGSTITTGKAILEPVTVSFNPFIRMQYSTLNNEGSPTQTLVMSEYRRSFTPISYAEISWDTKASDLSDMKNGDNANIKVRSAQWSTHTSAVKRTQYNAKWAGTNQVLPGGASYTLDTDGDYPVTVKLTTYQWVIEDSCAKQQFNSDAVDYYTQERAQTEHNSFVKSVESGLEGLNLEQWVSANLDDGTAFGSNSQVYTAGEKNEVLPNGVDEFNNDKKYVLNQKTGKGGKANEADLDTSVGSTNTQKFEYYADSTGNIHTGGATIGKTSESAPGSGMAGEIEKRTLMGEKLIAALERNTGSDGTAPWGSTWYNEGMNKITCYVQTTEIKVGLAGPDKRTVVLDPKLCPRMESKGNVFTSAYITQYKSKPYSDVYGEDDLLGTFKGEDVYTKKLDHMFWSRPFYIPNMTVQDLS